MASSSDTDNDAPSTSTKKISKKSYAHKYKADWEQIPEFQSWIRPSNLGITHFKCLACGRDYIGGMAAIKKHNISLKHVKRLNTVKQQKSVTEMKVFKQQTSTQQTVKLAEIRLASFIVEHNISITAVDHLVSLIKNLKLDENSVKKLSCNRTKCTALINNAIGHTSFEILVDSLKNNKFSILVDESTDHSAIKNLAIVVRLNDNFNVSDNFLALLPVSDATAANLYNVIKTFLTSHNINFKNNLIGFAADGANAMMGVHHSLKTMLMNDVPHLFVIKCICHSLALCASYACSKLPPEPEKLVRDIFTYMQYSFKRFTEFKEFQVFLNLKPHKLLHPAQTRWLSLSAVIVRTLEQYDALKLYFQGQHFDNVQASSAIFNSLNNPVMKVYLEFLEYVLPIFNDLNLEFQSESPKIHILYERMATTYKTILQCYLKIDYVNNTDVSAIQYRNPEHYKPLENIYCGPKVAIAFEKNVLDNQQKHNVLVKFLDFYIEGAHQIYKRFPFNTPEIKALKYLKFLYPKSIKSIDSIGPAASCFPYLDIDLNMLDREWRLLQNSNIDTSLDCIQFWKQNCNLKKGDDSPLYPELTKFVSALLVLPHSSACVERIFSTINLNKTKTRNKLSSETLSGILHSKRQINENNHHCFDYNIPDKVLVKHSALMYSD